MVVASALIARLHVFFWDHAGQYGGDDGYTMALGERLIDGHYLPYVDGCSHRGPVLYWAAAVAQLVTGRFGWMGARLLCAVTTSTTFLGVFAIGVVARRPFGGAIGALFFAWSALTVLAVSPGFAITGEGVASPLAVLALLFTSVGLLRIESPRPRLGALLVGGVLAALAGLAKQTALPIVVPLTVWTVAHCSRPYTGGLGIAPAVSALIGGFLGTLGLVILRYLVAGQLHAFVYWYYTYNSRIYMSPYNGVKLLDAFTGFMYEQPWVVGGFMMGTAWSIVRVLVPPPSGYGRGLNLLRAYAAAGLECTAAWIALALYASAVAPMRFWPHYFLPVLPFFGLVLGLRGEQALPFDVNGRRAPLASFALLLAAVCALGFCVDRRLSRLRFEAAQGVWRAEKHEPVCDVIDQNSEPEDPLFVWGFSGDLYLTCHRHPASRYVYLTLVAGIVPPDWNNVREDRVAEGARENLVSDLKERRPPVVLDVPAGMGEISFTQIPVVAPFIQANYCKAREIRVAHQGIASVWIRRDLPRCNAEKRPSRERAPHVRVTP